MNSIVFFSLFIFNSITWKLIYSTFGDKQISTIDIDGWEFFPIVGTPQIFECSTNKVELIWIGQPSTVVSKRIINIIPHYKIKSVQDFYIYCTFNNEYTKIYMDNLEVYNKIWDYKNMARYFRICFNVDTTCEVQTLIEIKDLHYSNDLTLSYSCNLDQQMGNEALFIRNVQVLIKPCHETCLTCSGGLINDCLTCHYQNQSSGNCEYCQNPSYLFTHGLLGCVSECPTNYLAQDNNFCVFDEKIVQLLTAYQGISFTNQDFDYLEDEIFQNSLYFLSKIQNCNSHSIAGNFFHRETLVKMASLPYGVSLLRIRATLYLFNNWINQEKLYFIIDNHEVSYIHYNNGNVYMMNGQIIQFVSNQICNNLPYDQIRIEIVAILTKPYSSIQIKFRASLSLDHASSWGIRDFTLDIGYCSFNCQICKNRFNCNICDSGYKLHKGQCIQDCPSYSTDMGTSCKDFDEETDMTVYEVKAFYDLSTDDETANNMFTLVSENPPNFSKGSSIYFSYLINKRIFGGTLVWRNAKFRKIITITEPHHGIRIRMNVILGDDFAGGSFIYTINSVATTLTRSTPGGIDEQIWGAVENEYQIQVDTNKINNDSTGSYTFEVECLSSKAIILAYCGISDLFITIYKCPFQCASCNDDFTCHSYLGSVNFNSLTETCSDGYYKDYAINDCVQCQLNNCLKCDDQYTCTQCDSAFTLTPFGSCQCLLSGKTISNLIYINNSLLNQCVDCHSQCKTCFDETEFGCYECKDTNRLLFNSECVCFPFYSDTKNGECEPICGDMVIVGDEECDDGNQVRFDGCHMCRYECQEQCSNCLTGSCYQCSSSFKLNSIIKRCYSEEAAIHYFNFPEFVNICGDGIQQENEECDDANNYPFDGCHNCLFSCIEYCENCIFGKCLRCQVGWVYDQFTETCQKAKPMLVPELINQLDFNSKPCEVQFCLLCINEICLQCDQNLGFELDRIRNQCYYNCKKQNTLAESYYDIFQGQLIIGCSMSCEENCRQCAFGVCLQCEKEFNLFNNKCLSNCGDQIITQLEDCDDNNNDMFDGCWKCQYSCDPHCKTCIQGYCTRCEEGYIINISKGQCESKCEQVLVSQNFLNTECQIKCPEHCESCLYGVCILCQFQYTLTNGICQSLCGNGIMDPNEECDDGNNRQFDGCHNCKFELSSNCIISQFKQCFLCEVGWKLNNITRKCEPICGDNLIRGNEVCDDGNNIPSDGCFQCQFQCHNECEFCVYGICYGCRQGWQLLNQQCFPICGDLLLNKNEQCDDGNETPNDGCFNCQYSQIDHCEHYALGKCLKCQPNWSYNELTNFYENNGHQSNSYELSSYQTECLIEFCVLCLHNECLQCNKKLGFQLDRQNNQCYYDCNGASITTLITLFDWFQHNFLYHCNINCPQNCEQCSQELCLSCSKGYYIENNECLPKCGEIIEFGYCSNDLATSNLILNGNCSKNCQTCQLNICIQCDIGWSMDSITGNCEAYCGDGLKIGQEECDDGNNEPYDGCYQCEYQCQQECEYCFLGVCYECAQGWFLKNSNCNTICGDGVINGTEECDDGNDLPYDGCFQCKFQCNEGCGDCVEGACVECDFGFLRKESGCYSNCGDGQVAIGIEECDDSNTQNGDGCNSECMIEEGWSCNHLICEVSSPPLMYLNIVEDGEEKKKVQIRFTQKLIQTVVQTQFSLVLNSNELSDDDVTIDLAPLESASYLVYKEVIYEVTVTFNKNCLKSELVVELVNQQSLMNNLKQTISNSIAKVKLKQTNFLDETQKQVSVGVKKTVNAIFYGLLILFGISLLSGNLNIMWNTLDLLQFLSYLKYINVPFPINLANYFALFDYVTFGPILDITGFKQFMSLILGSETPYIKPSARFEDTNALLIENIQSICFVISVGCTIHYLQLALLLIVSKIELSTVFKIKTNNFCQKLKQQTKAFYFSELIRLFLSSSYELYFAIYLQLNNLNFEGTFFSVNSLLSIILLIIVSLINIHLLFNSNDYLAKHNKKSILVSTQNLIIIIKDSIQRKVQSLFEDISIRSYFSRMFNSLFLIRRNIFMLILIFLQNTPIPQAFLIAITSGIFLIYLVIQHPQENNYNQFNMLITEIIVQCCCLIFLLFEINNHFIQLFDFSIYLNLGWLCIGLLSGCLLCQFFLDLYQQVVFLVTKFKQFNNQLRLTNSLKMKDNEYPTNLEFQV